MITIVGFLLGVIMSLHRSVWPSVVAHGLFDAASLAWTKSGASQNVTWGYGVYSGVSQTTRNVLLESAYFQPAGIRRTARELNLPSDASYRFERGVDPAMVLPASQRAAQLIREIAGGKPADETTVAGTLPAPPPG